MREFFVQWFAVLTTQAAMFIGITCKLSSPYDVVCAVIGVVLAGLAVYIACISLAYSTQK